MLSLAVVGPRPLCGGDLVVEACIGLQPLQQSPLLGLQLCPPRRTGGLFALDSPTVLEAILVELVLAAWISQPRQRLTTGLQPRFGTGQGIELGLPPIAPDPVASVVKLAF